MAADTVEEAKRFKGPVIFARASIVPSPAAHIPRLSESDLAGSAVDRDAKLPI
ncbi:MAG: hypothetical protein ACI9D0_002013 [Bacteroidia bacterium]|jgi:hypothetical protein